MWLSTAGCCASSMGPRRVDCSTARRILRLVAEYLDFQWRERHADGVERARSGAAVRFLHLDCSGGLLLDRAGGLRLLLVAVEDAQLTSRIVQRVVDDHRNRARRGRVGVGNDDDLLVHQDSRESEHAVQKGGDAVVLSVARDGAEIEAAVSQRWARPADRGDPCDVGVVKTILRKARTAPERFTNRRVAAGPVQPLLGAVVNAGDAR